MTSFMALHGATLVDNGYHILPIIPGEKAPGQFAFGRWIEMADWSRFCERAPNPDYELPIWEEWPEAGVGIACGRIVGLDIDVMDSAMSVRLAELAHEIVGETPAIRFGQRPKRMLVYRCDEPFPSFNAGPLQVMASGRQFVAHGIHPVTQAPYDWPEGSLAQIDRDQLPAITHDQARAWVSRAAGELGIEWPPRERAGGAGRGDKEPGTRAAVEQALRFIRSDCKYPDWRDIGMAIKAGLGEDGCDLWHSWSARDDGRYDVKQCDRQWASFRNDKAGGIGVGTLYDRAERGGWVSTGAGS